LTVDEIALLRALSPDAEEPDAAARADALRALQGRFEGTAPVPSAQRFRHRRGALAAFLAGAAALAAIGAAVLPAGSGPRTELAAAEVLKRTAIIAESSNAAPMRPPAPGQFFYLGAKLVELQGWLPDGPGTGPKDDPRYFTAHIPGDPDARAALVRTSKQFWISRNGDAHTRETLEQIEFLSAEDQELWQDAGSPPPFSFDPSERSVERDASGRPVKEFDSSQAAGVFLDKGVFADLSHLPTKPRALRLAVEYPEGGAPAVPSQAAPRPVSRNPDALERLTTILIAPTASPALRAAAFNALAEIPGIELEPGVTDVAGRRGDAIAWEVEPGSGFRHEFIFDPRTSKVLASAQVLAGEKAAEEEGVPEGTVFRETAFLRSGIVDSLDETASVRPDAQGREGTGTLKAG
jgi:hypothetical protein